MCACARAYYKALTGMHAQVQRDKNWDGTGCLKNNIGIPWVGLPMGYTPDIFKKTYYMYINIINIDIDMTKIRVDTMQIL